jgi:hypothetical protein
MTARVVDKDLWCELQEAWGQDELIGDKSPDVK